MTNISLIAVVDEQYGLGKDNQLLCHLPADLKRFKTLTMGKPIIMGWNTYTSIGKPLPGRTNIVLTRKEREIEGVTVAGSLDQALSLVAKIPEVMIIGGASLYEQTIPLASKIYLTLIHHQFKADVFFPKLDKSLWLCVDTVFRARDEKNNYDLTFCSYERLAENN